MLGCDAIAQLNNFLALDELRKTMRTTQTSALARVGNCLAAVPHYSNTVTEVFALLASLETHHTKICEINSALYATPRQLTDQCAKKLQDMVEKLGFLLQELQ